MLNPKKHYPLWYALLATANACFGFLFFTYNIVIFNALIPFFRNFLFPDRSEFLVVFIASCPLLTSIAGALIGGALGLRFGRRKLMLIGDIIAIAGVILTLFKVLAMMIVGRLLLGFTIGITATVAPLYFTELAPVDYRGEFTNVPTIFGAIGILIATLLGLLVPGSLAPGETDGTWRILLSLAIVPLALRILNFLVLFRYETPYVYVHRKKFPKAAKILRKTGTDDIPGRLQEIIKERDYVQSDGQVRFSALFTKRFRKALIVGILITSLQYLSGLNLMLTFTGGIYSSGIAPTQHVGQILGVTTSMVNFFASIFSIWTTSQFGRKPLLVLGTFLTGVCTLMYGILAQAISPDDVAPKVFLVIWPIPWNLSLGSVLYVVIAETLPDVGVSVATIFNWVFAWLTLQFFPDASHGMGIGWTWIMYGIITIVGALLLLFFLVETKGKNKDEILKLYSGEVVPAKIENAIQKAEENHNAYEVLQAQEAIEAKNAQEAGIAEMEARDAEIRQEEAEKEEEARAAELVEGKLRESKIKQLKAMSYKEIPMNLGKYENQEGSQGRDIEIKEIPVVVVA